MKKFIISNRGKGNINTSDPITESNLFQVEKATGVFVEGDNIGFEIQGDNIVINKLPKPSVDISGSSPSLPTNYNAKWLNLTGTTPTLTISGTFAKDDEIEGSHSGTGVLTIEGSGITLIYPEEYFTNTYPAGGVFGIKFTSPTTAVLFGKQIPVGL